MRVPTESEMTLMPGVRLEQIADHVIAVQHPDRDAYEAARTFGDNLPDGPARVAAWLRALADHCERSDLLRPTAAFEYLEIRIARLPDHPAVHYNDDPNDAVMIPARERPQFAFACNRRYVEDKEHPYDSPVRLSLLNGENCVHSICFADPNG